jgi:hypothetical protein
MKKQTAVEWLEEIYLTTGIDRNVHFHQAKAMEKAQIIRAFCEGYDHDGDNYDRAEIKYYEKTYGL